MARLPGAVAVIGSGLAGLASSVVLAARGHEVVVYEKNPWLGGKAAVLEECGFRFDMGPTILTLPSVLRRIFAEAGRTIEEDLPMTRLDPQWRCLFEGGDVLDLRENAGAMAAELDKFAGGRNSAGYRDFLAVSKRLHEITERFFFWKSVGGLRDTLDMRRNMNPETLAQVLALRMGSTVAGIIRRRVPDARVAQMLDHFTQYVGSSPFASPAVLCAIGHMQTCDGIWYPHGGTRAVADGLISLGRSLGVRHLTGVGITRILSRGGRVSAIQSEDGTEIPVAAVVSNMDSVRTYRELVGGEPGRRFERERKREPACSGVVLYLGLNRAYEHLAHHTFVFSRDPKREFEDIYRRGEPADDPTAYIAAPSRTDPSVAPPGGEALYVLVHTPYLRPHHDWSKMLPQYRRIILDKLKRTGQMPDLESRIVFERVLTPQDIHDRYRVLNGAIYGLASHGRFLGAFKPGNISRHMQGLYLAGGAAHPGPGMPMVLMSGWIAADALDRAETTPRAA